MARGGVLWGKTRSHGYALSFGSSSTEQVARIIRSSFSLGVPSPSADHAVTARRKEAHLATLRAAGRLLMLQSRTRKGEVGSEELI